MQSGVNEQSHPRRLGFYSLGFFRPNLKRQMNTLGFELVPFGIGSHDGVVIWGRKPVSKRGIKRARAKSLPLLTVEDGFIRSLRPGWQEAPRSLTIDWTGPYFDANQENDLRNMLLNAGKIDEARARKQMALQVKLGISKYNAHLRTGEAAPAVYVIDQVRDDQSVLSSGGDEALFQKIRKFAETKFPHANIIMRGHPAGLGYFRDAKTGENTKIETSPANPFDLIEEAEEIITLSSQMGFDAIIAGKRPIVFGMRGRRDGAGGHGTEHRALGVASRHAATRNAQEITSRTNASHVNQAVGMYALYTIPLQLR